MHIPLPLWGISTIVCIQSYYCRYNRLVQTTGTIYSTCIYLYEIYYTRTRDITKFTVVFIGLNRVTI